ncbi:MAG: DNA polymerase III subunit delta [Candidatus Nealsonbacteria bacterium CG08_land_8_20_14_0_20_38_20]|uniref:DNA polymerase III subunit delta n=1 Tax=Candidatus Nealsonbacteria bacterium CG08_land_8_20_14_0_20_38_20 TaxID=1974705 RepID=A0A2H0YNV8_9BACT|nr:MAG: DNA polymerase III subunit delta [Candidatus Nealsonbacteria bacterium CG08_land_8_20_14_0_20_38_20]
MIIFLYGQDTYRSKRKLNELVEHYKKIRKAGLNLKYFDFKEDSFNLLKDEIQQVPIFKEKKLLILKNAFSNPEFGEKLLKNLRASESFFRKSDDIILFYEEGKVKKNALFNFLKKNAKSQEFNFLEGEKLKNWAIKEFKNYGAKIQPQALNKLIEFVGQELWQFSEEIKKLVNYKNGEIIREKDVEILVKPKIETDIFKTIETMASKNKKEALKLIHRHLEKGAHPLYLFSMINYQFRNLLMVKSLGQKYPSYYAILKASQLHPFVVKKAIEQSQKFELEELKKIYQKLFEIDLDIKRGRVEPETALDMLIAEI